MINDTSLFSEIGGGVAIWIPSGAMGTELAHSAETAIAQNSCAVSVEPDSVSVVWPWLEKTPIKILARFYLEHIGVATADKTIADLSMKINTVFKTGANGAQIFMNVSDVPVFCRYLGAIRDDLFFNKHLSIGLDISKIDATDWASIFDNLAKIRADSVVFTFVCDAGEKSDFVGRVYGMLNQSRNWNGKLHFVLGDNMQCIEQVWRLTSAIRPDDVENLSFFVKV